MFQLWEVWTNSKWLVQHTGECVPQKLMETRRLCLMLWRLSKITTPYIAGPPPMNVAISDLTMKLAKMQKGAFHERLPWLTVTLQKQNQWDVIIDFEASKSVINKSVSWSTRADMERETVMSYVCSKSKFRLLDTLIWKSNLENVFSNCHSA